MVKVYGINYLSPDEAARLLQIKKRALNRWAITPESAPERARALSPIVQLNGRRLYPLQNVLDMVKEVFGRDLTFEEVNKMLDDYVQEESASTRLPPLPV